MDQPTLASLLRAGQPGTQSGPVLESDEMQRDRMIQSLLGLGLGIGGVGGSLLGQAEFGIPATGTGVRLIQNAREPYIGDVFGHGVHQWLKHLTD